MPRLSPKQKAERRSGIGASDLAELMGISPFEGKSPMRLYAEKAGILPDDDEDEEETTEKKLGHALEGALVRLYEQESGFRVLTSGEYVETVIHASEPWARCNLDGRVVGKRAALEVKLVGVGMMRDWDLDSDDGIPPYVRTQCIWQMFVADLDEVHVVACVGGTGFRVFYIQRHLELEAAAVAEARQFWINVSRKILPPLDATSATKSVLDRLYPPPATDVEVELEEKDEALIEYLDRRVKAADIERNACEVKETMNNAIRKGMGDLGATVVFSPRVKATYRTNKKGARTLLVTPIGASKEPRITARKSNVETVALKFDDGDVF